MPESQALEPAPSPDTPSHEPAYKRVSVAEQAKIFRLRHVEGFGIEAIADALDRSTETISRHLSAYDQPTVEHAKRLLESAAHPAAEVLVNQLESEDERIQQGAASKVLTAAGLMTTQHVQVGVQVVLGTPDTPVSYDPFAPKS